MKVFFSPNFPIFWITLSKSREERGEGEEREEEHKQLQSVMHFTQTQLLKNGILFLQETRSTFNDDNISKNDFGVPVFYSHGTSSSCVVLIAYFGNLNFSVNKEVSYS